MAVASEVCSNINVYLRGHGKDDITFEGFVPWGMGWVGECYLLKETEEIENQTARETVPHSVFVYLKCQPSSYRQT